METINSRIRTIREKEDVSQRAFGDLIGISGTAVAHIESGTNNPSEQTIRAICKEFRIDRHWLETGEGNMYSSKDEDDEIVDSVLAGDDEFIKAVIRGIAKTPGGWEKMREVFNAIQEELQTNKPET